VKEESVKDIKEEISEKKSVDPPHLTASLDRKSRICFNSAFLGSSSRKAGEMGK
jgi:hypothetical protein